VEIERSCEVVPHINELWRGRGPSKHPKQQTYSVEIGLGLDKGLGYSCTETGPGIF